MREAILSPERLARDIEALSAGAFLQNPYTLIEDAIDLLTPPERVSTVECAEKYRLLPGPEDGSVIRYDRWRTPYNVGPQNSLDDPKCSLLVMAKPSRSGGTAIVENHLFKRIMFGPMGHVSWVLNSDEAVTDYCRSVVKPMFELNEGLQARVGKGRGDDTDTFKRVRGYPLEWLSAKDSTFRNRQPLLMVSDETDAWSRRYAKSPKVQIDGRQKLLGNRRKAAILSHPDLGWTAGVAATYEDSSRGIFVMQCAECLEHAAAFATKFWDVPQFKLAWQRNDELDADTRLDLAERTAAMLCPHCGAALDDEQRRGMIDKALGLPNTRDGWMHRGQTLDAVEGVLGEMLDHQVHGYWVHGLMLKTEALGKLAREYEAALIDFERTRDPDKLKEFLSKALGEVYEGAATTGGLSANAIKARVRESDWQRGLVPPEVMFITAAVDTGARKFDVVFIGWDLEGRSWLLDRITIRQRRHADGQWRNLHLPQQIADWTVLWGEVAERLFPLRDRPGWALPVACVTLDSGDGNVTWKAREFARRSLRKGYVWGKDWSRFKLIKGDEGKRPIVPEQARKVDKDEFGKPVQPVILEYTLGADRLKDLIYERLAVTDGGPGQINLPEDLEPAYVDEFFGEAKIDGKWRRHGRNETLDLYGYAEAARLILKPDREDIRWAEGKLPPWARPVRLPSEGGDPEAPAGEDGKPPAQQTQSLAERMTRLGKKGR